MIDKNKALNEVPAAQRRKLPESLDYYFEHAKSRNEAIVDSYKSGGYTLQAIGDFYNLHYSTVSGIIRNHKSKT